LDTGIGWCKASGLASRILTHAKTQSRKGRKIKLGFLCVRCAFARGIAGRPELLQKTHVVGGPLADALRACKQAAYEKSKSFGRFRRSAPANKVETNIGVSDNKRR
jgi:hypothetical protein